MAAHYTLDYAAHRTPEDGCCADRLLDRMLTAVALPLPDLARDLARDFART
jgi:hypothetical protein